MLSKTGAFAFVNAVQQKDKAGAALNGYLLEFDNGRNLFISNVATDLTPLREFVYGLRDDGKLVHLAFINAPDEQTAAEMASLLQPQIAVVVNSGGMDRARLSQALEEQIFNGEWRLATPSESTPF